MWSIRTKLSILQVHNRNTAKICESSRAVSRLGVHGRLPQEIDSASQTRRETADRWDWTSGHHPWEWRRGRLGAATVSKLRALMGYMGLPQN
jgi:hypothetical protein